MNNKENFILGHIIVSSGHELGYFRLGSDFLDLILFYILSFIVFGLGFVCCIINQVKLIYFIGTKSL